MGVSIINIKQIAKRAGVSVATISRVLNHPDLVQPETREHVLSVMKENSYTPNYFARALNLGRTNTIAILVPSVEKSMYQKIMAGIEEVSNKKKYTVIICNTHCDEKMEKEYINRVKDKNIDGIILCSSVLSEEDLKELREAKMPVVLVGKTNTSCAENVCYINIEDGAYKLTRHLLELGHKRIDLYLDSISRVENEYIISGYKRAIGDYKCSEGKIITTKDNSSAFLKSRKMFSEKDIPDAIFAATDEIVFMIMKAAKAEKIDIPERLAIAAFNDTPVASLLTPELTSVEQPSKKLGMVAARLLFDLLESDEEDYTPQEIILQPKLRIRKSCGNIKDIYEFFE